MTRDEKFFYEHAASYSVAQGETQKQGRIRGAKALAKAEAYAHSHGWEYEWQDDPEGCSGCDCGSEDCACFTGESHEVLGCVLKYADGEVLESLWGICGATREYMRVVEAELASEAMPETEVEPTGDIPLKRTARS